MGPNEITDGGGLSPLEELAHGVLEYGLEVTSLGLRDSAKSLEELWVRLRDEFPPPGHYSSATARATASSNAAR